MIEDLFENFGLLEREIKFYLLQEALFRTLISRDEDFSIHFRKYSFSKIVEEGNKKRFSLNKEDNGTFKYRIIDFKYLPSKITMYPVRIEEEDFSKIDEINFLVKEYGFYKIVDNFYEFKNLSRKGIFRNNM